MPTIDDYRNKYPSLKALDDSALIDRVAEVQGAGRAGGEAGYESHSVKACFARSV